VSSFNSRTGAVSLTADDLLDKLEAGANTQLALNQATGKVRVTATATSNGSGITDTDGLPEGVGNLYFTGARVLATKLAGYAKSSAYAALGVGSTLLGWLQQIEYRLDSKQDKDTYAPLAYARLRRRIGEPAQPNRQLYPSRHHQPGPRPQQTGIYHQYHHRGREPHLSGRLALSRRSAHLASGRQERVFIA
jgi:hypothetical protein